MARVTVEDCLEHVDNRFELVLRATRRARQLDRLDGADPDEARVDPEDDKNTVIALREVAEGLVTDEVLEEADARIQKEQQAQGAEEGPFGYGDDRDDDF